MAKREQVRASSLKIIFVCGRMFHRSLVKQKQASVPPLIFIPNAEEVFLGEVQVAGLIREWED